MACALISGISGQDGSYLAEFLIEKGYEVHGIIRPHQSKDPSQSCPALAHIIGKIRLHAASFDQYSALEEIVKNVRPDECYHFAAQSFVHNSPYTALETFRPNIEGTHVLLQAILKNAPGCRFYFAGTSEMFGNAKESPQKETTPFNPRNVYGISKLAGYHLMRAAREENNLFACAGICFNHESPRRGSSYVTQKVVRAVVRIASGSDEKLKLGNLATRRDWGYAPDYIRAMWGMLQQSRPDDYVLASGETHSVEEFVNEAFSLEGLNWKDHVEIDSELLRIPEKTLLCGDPSKARSVLGWKPSVSFNQLIKIMITAEKQRFASSQS